MRAVNSQHQGINSDLEVPLTRDTANETGSFAVGSATTDDTQRLTIFESAGNQPQQTKLLSPRQSPLLTSSVEQSPETVVCPAPESFLCVWISRVVVSRKAVINVVVLMNVVVAITQMIKHKCWIDDTAPLTSIAETFGALGGFAIVGSMHVLRDATSPNNGAMIAMGAGSGGLTLKAAGNSSTKLGLQCWDKFLFSVMVGVFIFGALWLTAISSGDYGNLRTAIPSGDVLTIIFCLASYAWWCVAVPLILACFFSMKVCARLAMYRIITVRRSAAIFAPGTEDWEQQVVVATRELINTVLYNLSQAFGNFVVTICLFCWAMALYHLCYGLAAREEAGYAWVTSFVLCFFFVCAPLFVFYDLAMGGTECDKLVAALNDKRIAEPTDVNHQNILKLEVMIKQLFKGQGLGFTVYGIVLDTKYFSNLFVKLFGVAVTAMGTLLALARDSSNSHEQCAPTALQIKIVQDLFANNTCIYNMTIKELLAMKRPQP